MADTSMSAPPSQRRATSPRRLWSATIENVPVEERVRQIDDEIAQLGPHLARRARGTVIALLITSATVTGASAFWNMVDVIPHAAIVIATLTVFPTVLSAWEWLHHNNAQGRYQAWTERQTNRLSTVIRRQRLNKVFARYGRQEISARLNLQDSAWYTLAAQDRRLRIRWVVMMSVVLVCVAAFGIDVTVYGHHDVHKKVGQEFTLGSLYKLTVTANATCTKGQSSQESTCSVPITVLNATSDPQIFSEVDISHVTSTGPYYWVPDPVSSALDPVDFATSLVGPSGGHYYYDSFSPSENDLQPGQSASDIFIYDYAYGAKITELVFDAAEDGRTTIHVSIGTT